MRYRKDSIRFKVLLPIVALVFMITAALLFFVQTVSHNVSVKYFEFVLTEHTAEAGKITDLAVNDLISSRLLHNNVVLEAKQKAVMDQLADYWKQNDLDGLVLKADRTVLFITPGTEIEQGVRPFFERSGPFHVEIGLKHFNGHTKDFPVWGWKIVTMHKPVSWYTELHRKEIILLLPVIVICMALLIASIYFVLTRNFQRPVAHMITDIAKGGVVATTGLRELDTIGAAINDAFQRLRGETARAQSFREVIDAAFDVVMMMDEQKQITYVNPVCERVTGYTARELIGQKAGLLFGVQEEDLYDRVWQTVMQGSVWKGEFLNRKKDGEPYYTSAVVFPVPGGGRTIYVSVQRDITQEKRLYEHLLRSQKLEALGTLAGGFAHDFNNILTAILGYAELIRDMSREGDPAYKPAGIILNAAEQGAQMTKKILSITRQEKAVVKPANLNELIYTSLDLLQRSIPKTIEIVTRLSEAVPPVLADVSQIQQVIVNLAINSRDAMPEGGTLVLGTEFQPQAAVGSLDGKFVKLFVSDTGTGMDVETQRKIFDPFFTTKDTGKGTGLGLYIVHSIVKGHGGHMNVYSMPGMGTTFNIYLPVTKEVETGMKEEGKDIRGAGTVLLIDDEPFVRELCKDILEYLGYTVLSAGGGIEGIGIFREMKDRIAVVVLDMIMPKMGGAEVFQVLKTLQPEVRVILCSGYSQEGMAGIENLLRQGVKKFVQKPFTRDTIGRALKEVLHEPVAETVPGKSSGDTG